MQASNYIVARNRLDRLFGSVGFTRFDLINVSSQAVPEEFYCELARLLWQVSQQHTRQHQPAAGELYRGEGFA